MLGNIDLSNFRVGTLFSGYDAQMLGMRMLMERHPEFNATCVFWCEIDKYACQAHDLVFPEYQGLNLGDITQVDWSKVPYADLVTWSYPCTSISMAGRRAGMVEGSGTASSLGFEALKCFKVLKPKYLLMENVPALLYKQNAESWKDMLNRLEEMGYANFFQVLDASRYGVPQARKRVFMLSILKTDDNPNPHYVFPAGEEPKLCIRDIMEDEVPDNYWLKNEKADPKISQISMEKLINFIESD